MNTRYFCSEKPMAPPPHIPLAASKIRSVFEEGEKSTCRCGQRRGEVFFGGGGTDSHSETTTVLPNRAARRAVEE